MFGCFSAVKFISAVTVDIRRKEGITGKVITAQQVRLMGALCLTGEVEERVITEHQLKTPGG